MSFRDGLISALSVMVLVLLGGCEGLQLGRSKVTKEYVAGYRITDKHVSVDYSDSDNTTATAQVRVVDHRGDGVGGLGVQFKIACEAAAPTEEPEPTEEPVDPDGGTDTGDGDTDTDDGDTDTDDGDTDTDDGDTDTDDGDTDTGDSDTDTGDGDTDTGDGDTDTGDGDTDTGDNPGMDLVGHVSHMSPPVAVPKCETAAMSDDVAVDKEDREDKEDKEGNEDTTDKEEECVEEEDKEDSAVKYGAFSDFGGVIFTDEDGIAELLHQPLGDFSNLSCTIAVSLSHRVGDLFPEDEKEEKEEPEEKTDTDKEETDKEENTEETDTDEKEKTEEADTDENEKEDEATSDLS